MKRLSRLAHIERLCNLISEPTPQTYHFTGIQGCGMWPLAHLTLHTRYHIHPHLSTRIQGTDLKPPQASQNNSATFEILRQASSIIPQSPPHPLLRALIYTAATTPNHPERIQAKENQLPTWHRGELLAALSTLHKCCLFITGSSGKTSTTAYVAHLFQAAGQNPNAVVGGKMLGYNRQGYLLGDACKLWIAEADESDHTIELYQPNIAIITNLTDDHVEGHGSFSALKQSLLQFAKNTKQTLIISADDPQLQSCFQNPHQSAANVISVGYHKDADYRILPDHTHLHSFALQTQDTTHGTFTCSGMGKHQLINASMAMIAAHSYGMSWGALQKHISTFQGVARRLEVVYQSDHCIIINDYAHNPEKIATAIAAAYTSYPKAYIEVVFEPHKEARVMYQHRAFYKAFQQANHVILAPLYEPIIDGVVTTPHSYNAISYGEQIAKSSQVHLSHLACFQQTRHVITAKKHLGGCLRVIMILGAGKSENALLSLLSVPDLL